MSLQIFLEGKLLGIDEFLLAPTTGDADALFIGRSHWASLLGELIPRALLEELGLAKILLGSSGGGQFLLVLPEEVRVAAETFLADAAREISTVTNGTLRLVWSITENLGDWSLVRKRLQDQFELAKGTPASISGGGFFESPSELPAGSEHYFSQEIGTAFRSASSVSWSPEARGRVALSEGKYSWPLAGSSDALPLARHAAPGDDGRDPASTAVLAHRSSGHASWGVLRGDVDNFSIRLRRAQSIEEHIQLSVMYKQFFAGELEVLCSMPEFWRKVTVVYSGGDDFAVYGAWDALLGLAAEMQRLFHRFAEQNLKDFEGLEAKTITMALALAPALDASLGSVFEEAGRRLEAAKSSGKDCIWVLGRTLEWRQYAEASQLKDSLMRMVTDFGCSGQYLRDLCGIYRESQTQLSKRQLRKQGGERPWRYYRRIRVILGASRKRSSKQTEYRKARAALIADLIGKSALTVKLRPAGRVALEWARLSAHA